MLWLTCRECGANPMSMEGACQAPGEKGHYNNRIELPWYSGQLVSVWRWWGFTIRSLIECRSVERAWAGVNWRAVIHVTWKIVQLVFGHPKQVILICRAGGSGCELLGASDFLTVKLTLRCFLFKKQS